MNEYHNLPVGMNRVFLPGQIEIQEVSPEARLKKNSAIIH
jgi:hypothetical protein